ncbi:MAG: type II secretion system F family protein [Pseudomonadota bacterium]|nr:type II secretion system F family protein [Pseudomonadota bacterium]
MMDLLASNTLARLALLLALFLIVVAGAYLGTMALDQRRGARRRLATDVSTGGVRTSGFGSLRAQERESVWMKLVESIERSGVSLVDTRSEALRTKLAAAGFTAPYAPRLYTLIRLALVIALPLLMLALMWLGGSRPGIMKLYFVLMFAALAGLYVPALLVRARADRRKQQILNAFPDALDLMLICVEAGLGLEASFARVGQEMATTHPLLAEQFGAVVLELRAGRSREEALRRMADRAGVDEIRAFATLLIQSTKLGSSIAQTLRIYASEMREKRRMRAEEKAHRLPVLISIPLVACMLPVMIGVLLLPAVIRVMRTVLPAMQGGAG